MNKERDRKDNICSYGILCYRKNNDIYQFLMVQRKDSICYVDFVRGKYNMFDIKYILRLLSGMTIEERNFLMNKSFEVIWNHLWMTNKRYNQEYHVCKEKFHTLKKGFIVFNAIEKYFVNLKSMIYHTLDYLNEPEWDFPKGRRSSNESLINCALREFQEESGIKKDMIKLYPNLPNVIFKKLGCNDIMYKTIFYIGQIENIDENILPLNDTQVKEVKDVRWMSKDDVISKLHNYQQKHAFENIYKIIDTAESIN
jgi:8-oxo-dGTP pyrophosphatase MutT (NUDIX family)